MRKGVTKMSGAGGDGGGAFGEGLAADFGLAPIGESDGIPFGGLYGGGSEGQGTGIGSPAAEGPGVVAPAPVVSQVSTQTPEVVKESPKVEEGKADVKRKARRRSLLSGEEGGLEPTNIFRRTILGS